jgi:uncharacterized membrane protein
LSEKAIRVSIGALAGAGAAIAAYLLYVRTTGAPLVCSTGGCETVQESRYAELAGVPVAAIGLVGFLAIGATASFRGALAQMAGAALALGAFVFGAYLLVVQVALIGAVCQWCVATDCVTTALALTTLVRLRAGLHAAVPPTRRADPRGVRSGRGQRGSRGAASA